MTKVKPPAHSGKQSLDTLYQRPGFLIRRAHQISIDLFIEACSSIDVTPSQFGVMYILHLVGPLSQIGVARLIGLDRSTTALVVRILTERGLLAKTRSVDDARKAEIILTIEGRRLFRRAERLAEHEREQVLKPFSDLEAEQFMGLLTKFVGYFNQRTRVSMAGDALRVI
jgi:DNA-binding MarR family transcriptional regulator